MQSVINAGSLDDTIKVALKQLLQIATEALDTRGHFSLALSGGSTPKKLYEAITQSDVARALDWSRVSLFWSDERAVPPEHADSNYRMAMEYFSLAPFNKAAVYRMQAETRAAAQYEALILKDNGGIFDLILLGLGEDGHTASLFPDSSALTVTDKLVADTYIASKECWRMTLTFRCINQARNIIFLVTGKSKAKILHEVLYNKDRSLYPAQRIGSDNAPVLFIVDKDAAE